jgi:thiol:disulfide interchange protein
MSEPGTPNVSPWWALMLLPIALGVGWFAGQNSGTAPALRAQAADARSGNAGVSAALRAASSQPEAIQPSPGQAPVVESSAWTTFDDAITQSRRNGKLILIDFNAEWCPPCRALKQQVFDDGTRGQMVQEAVIPVSIVDRNREEGENAAATTELQRRFAVDAFPTLVILNPATGQSVRTEGFGDPDATIEWIRNAVRSLK